MIIPRIFPVAFLLFIAGYAYFCSICKMTDPFYMNGWRK